MFDELINKIEVVGSFILMNDLEKVKPYVSVLLTELLGVLPSVVGIYMKEDMAEYRKDAQYWPQEVEKLVNLMDGRDKLAIYDALYFEIRPNLMNLAQICKDKGIQLS